MTASTGDAAAIAGATSSPTSPAQGDIPADTFGARLVLARYHAGRFSIEKAAEKCGLNSENWRRWEEGAKPRDKVDVAQAVSEGLGINLNWILFGGPLLPAARGRAIDQNQADTVPYPVADPSTVRYRRFTDRLSVTAGRRPRLIERPNAAAA
jgi:hypothetical protein